LQEGKEKARKKSELVLKDVYDIVGFVKWVIDQNF
jgi:hypothetical protein